MKTAIMGAGAMGSLFGGLLALSGEDVWLVDIWKDHIDAIRSNGYLHSRIFSPDPPNDHQMKITMRFKTFEPK
jgi:ketopantoate reductase